MNLTQHFTLEELTFSSTAQRLGIDNTAPLSIIPCLTMAAVGMEKLRDLLGFPIHIDSGYRCPALNKAVGGAEDSAHLQGYAVDFLCPTFGSPLAIVARVTSAGIPFDELIQEGTWVHISFDPRARGKIMTAHFGPGVTTYTKGAP